MYRSIRFKQILRSILASSFSLLFAISAISIPQAVNADADTWTPAGNLNFSDEFHTTTLLTKSQVVIAEATGSSGYLASVGQEASLVVALVSQGLWLYSNAAWSQLTTLAPNRMVMYGYNLVANFSGQGLWLYDGATWTQLTPNSSVEDLIVVSGILYADYGVLGLWKYNGTWTQVTAANPNRLLSYQGNLVANFSGYGLYQHDGSSWTLLTDNSGATGMVNFTIVCPSGWGNCDGNRANGCEKRNQFRFHQLRKLRALLPWSLSLLQGRSVW